MRLRSFMFSSILGLAAAANGWAFDQNYNLPPAQMLMEPGPGVGGPGPGVLPPAIPPGIAGAGIACHQQQVQILFNRPEGMQVRWDVSGVSMFDSEPLVVPGRQNFSEAGIYRLKLTNIPGQEGVELYPTLEIGPTTPRTEAYLAHNAIPIQFTDEDFQQVLVGNFVTKVIYLPDPEFQELALAGVETLVSTRLDPGVDPIVEADRRGAIMAVLRLGNKDLEMGDGGGTGGVCPASFTAGGAPCGPDGCPIGMGGVGVPGMPGPPMMPNYVAGVTAPTYGYPYTGTPIGLPGPPHIPLGHPAGLQKHVIRNHTVNHIPGPVERFNIHVRQQPGYSYPKPPSHMWIREQTIYPTVNFHQPLWNRTQVVPQAGVPGSGTALFGQPQAGTPYCP